MLYAAAPFNSLREKTMRPSGDEREIFFCAATGIAAKTDAKTKIKNDFIAIKLGLYVKVFLSHNNIMGIT
jgi:hypothetical protein